MFSRATNSVVASLALVLTLLLMWPHKTAAIIEIGMLEPTKYSPSMAMMAHGLRAGINASINAVNVAGGVHGEQIVIRSLDTRYFLDNYTEFSQNLIATYPGIVAFLAVAGNEQIYLADLALRPHDMLDIGTIGFSTSARYWSDTNIMLRADPWAELLALATATASKFRLKRVAFHYGVEAGYGEEFEAIMTPHMRSFGIEWTYVYSWNYSDTTFDVNATMTELLSTRPDAIISFGRADPKTVEFLHTCLKHPMFATHTPKLKFLVTEAIVGIVEATLRTAASTYLSGQDFSLDDRVFSTFTAPIFTDMSYEVVRSYHRDMLLAHGEDGKTKFEQYHCINGYISARAAVEILKKTMPPLTPARLKQTAFSSNVIDVDDVTYGIYKGSCTSKHDKLCECNDGSNLISVGQMTTNKSWEAIPEAEYEWSISECGGRSLKPRQPTNYLQLQPEHIAKSRESNFAVRLQNGRLAAENVSTATDVTRGDVSSFVFTESSSSSRRVVEGAFSNKNKTLLVTVVAHSVIDSSAASEAPWPVVDPFYPTTLPTASDTFHRSVLHTSSTAEQELHAAAAFAAQSGLGTLTLAGVDTHVDPLRDAFTKSCVTFGLAAEVVMANLSVSLADRTAGLVVVVGVEEVDVPSIYAALNATGASELKVAFFSVEAAARYPAIVAQDAMNAAASERVIILTSLSAWGPAGAASKLITEYHGTLSGGATTADPLQLRSFIATKAIIAVLNDMKGRTTSPENFLNAWYVVAKFHLDDSAVLGPYYGDRCNELNVGACECNVGPRRVNVFALGSVLRGSSADPLFAHQFPLCSVDYRSPPVAADEGFSTMEIVAIAVSSVVAVVLVAAIIARRTKNERDVSAAPKDSSRELTLVFTDIQSSTALWARIPDKMGPALDDHHALIRELIVKHHGYEVKTIGDSFMIAFQHANDAVAMCVELQHVFLEHNWHTTAIDEAYAQLELERLEEHPESPFTPTQHFGDGSQPVLWQGLRVRCGVNTGLGDIKFDEVTKGYDYYGPVTNVASRTEAIAHGGQIVVTEDTLHALTTDVGLSINLGAVPLRGVSEPVPMTQIDAIVGRKFGPLRIDRAADFELDIRLTDGEPSENRSLSRATEDPSVASTHSGGSGSMDSSSVPVANCNMREALVLILSMLELSTRKSILKKLANKWHATVARGKKDDESKLASAICHRVLAVYQSKYRPMHRESTGAAFETSSGTCNPSSAAARYLMPGENDVEEP